MNNFNFKIFLAIIAAVLMTRFSFQGTTKIMCATSPSSSFSSVKKNGKTNKFDELAKQIYKEANTLLEERRRSNFTINGWKRGTGGLDDADRLTLVKLYTDANSVFEFGLGESTYIASYVNVPRYAGVDSDAKWVSDARDIVTNQNNSHFRFHFADIGMTESWGNPSNEKLRKIKYNYQIQSLFSELEPFDVYMIDGRYRVACACISFLHALKYDANMDRVRVSVHDNDERRRGYGILQNIADLEVQNRRLWVYKLKANVTEHDIATIYLKTMNEKM